MYMLAADVYLYVYYVDIIFIRSQKYHAIIITPFSAFRGKFLVRDELILFNLNNALNANEQ